MKRMNTKMWLFLACAFMGAPVIMAQEVQTQVIEEIKTPSGGEDLLFIYYRGNVNPNTASVFRKNTPVNYNAASLPRFAIIGKDKKYYLGIGGYVKGTISYDFNGVVNNPVDFITSDISVPRTPGNGAKVQGSVATSNIFFNFVGLPGTANEFGAYINANFNGPGETFQLQFAYITYRNFLLGYSTSLFTDAGALPPTIDFEGPNAATFVYNTILSYKYNFNKNWSMAASVEMPMLDITTEPTEIASVNQRVPDIPLYLQYAWDKGGSWVRASSLFRSMMYRDVMNLENKNEFGWGLKLSGAAKLCDYMHLYYQGVYGKGISNYIQDLYGLGLDMVPDPDKPGEMDRVESWGAYMGLQVNLSKNVFMSTTYSQDRVYMPSGQPAGSTYKYAQYVVTNLIWNILPNLQTGVEYLWGKRVNQDGKYGKANRIQTMLQLNF